MRKLIVFTNLTLDGVMQAPAAPDEDTRGSFQHGGWAAPYGGMQSKEVEECLPNFSALLFGRRTYENFYAYWPHQTDSPFSELLNNMQKYVASRTLTEPLPWVNSTLLKGNLAEAVTELKKQPGPNIAIMGSGEVIRSLIPHKLIDHYVLLFHPLVLGSGRRLFADDGTFANLRLVYAKPTDTGVIVASYEPAESPA